MSIKFARLAYAFIQIIYYVRNFYTLEVVGCCSETQLQMDKKINFYNLQLWAQQTQNICITFIQRRPNVFALVQHFINAIQIFCVCWVDQLCSVINDRKIPWWIANSWRTRLNISLWQEILILTDVLDQYLVNYAKPFWLNLYSWKWALCSYDHVEKSHL